MSQEYILQEQQTNSQIRKTILRLVMFRGTKNTKLNFSDITWRINKKTLRRILKIGFPASMEHFVRQSAMIFYSFLVASLGTFALAANEIVMNIQSISFMPGLGFGFAATTLVGQSLGAKKYDLAEKYGMETMKMAAFLMGTAGVFFFIWPQLLVSLYTTDPIVAETGIGAMRIVALLQPMFAMFLVLSGALRGAGDTKWVLYATALGNWGIRLVLGAFVAFYLNVGLVGFWVVVATDMTVRALVILWRYKSGNWKISIVENQKPVSTKVKGRRKLFVKEKYNKKI